MSDEKPENRKRWFWKDWPWWVKVIAVIWMLLPLFILFLDSNWISSSQKDVPPPEKDVPLPQEDVSPQILFNDVRTIMLVLAAWYGVPFLIWRTILADKQTQISQESHYTELFAKAVEQLGAVREVHDKEPEPALEIRIGAIYSLERLAKDSERDYGPIIETLAAYIREHCRDPKSFDGEDLIGEELKQARQAWIQSLRENPPADRSDVAAALTVLSRREKNRNWTSTSEDETQPDFTGANFQGATLWNKSEGLVLEGTNLRLADLSGARLSDADFSGANLSGTHLSGADLSNANLSGADLSSARLSGANLSGARLSRAILSDAVFLQANLSDARLSGANLQRAYLVEANLQFVRLSRAILSDAELPGAILQLARLPGANLQGANLADTNLSYARLADTNLSYAILARADLSHAELSEANLSGANLSGADLSHAELSEANLLGSLLVGAQLQDVEHLTPGMINEAFGDNETTLPADLPQPAHWGNQEDVIEQWQVFWEMRGGNPLA